MWWGDSQSRLGERLCTRNCSLRLSIVLDRRVWIHSFLFDLIYNETSISFLKHFHYTDIKTYFDCFNIDVLEKLFGTSSKMHRYY